MRSFSRLPAAVPCAAPGGGGTAAMLPPWSSQTQLAMASGLVTSSVQRSGQRARAASRIAPLKASIAARPWLAATQACSNSSSRLMFGSGRVERAAARASSGARAAPSAWLAAWAIRAATAETIRARAALPETQALFDAFLGH